MNYFIIPIIISLLVLVGVGAISGWAGLFTAMLLVVLEVTLSFDNAVVNARVLARMDERWQRRFLTWGILIAVFGTRLVLPILIVSASVWASPVLIAKLAAFSPEQYAEHLHGARYTINSFGATFLLLVALKYFFDEAKTIHWIGAVERFLTGWGRIEAIEVGLTLTTVLVFASLVPADARAAVLVAGMVGAISFIVIEGLGGLFTLGTKDTAVGGAMLFLYLNFLDSAFSLDSVVGAFALTTSILVIAAGLGIGAYFVRALTIYLVQKKTLDTLLYLEHGAHWAIFGLAASMFAGLLFEVPEIITGSIGLLFVLAAYYSSLHVREMPETI